ncbi:MAG: hypothetical protein AAGC57_17095 [Pseudomonadota bacterium]
MTMANMRERLGLRIDPSTPVERIRQQVTRQIDRRVRGDNFRNASRGGGDRVAGRITHRTPRQNRTNVNWEVNAQNKKTILVLQMIVDVAAMGGSSNDARRQILGWFHGM